MSFEYKTVEYKVNYLGFRTESSPAYNAFCSTYEQASREEIGKGVVTVAVSDTELNIGGTRYNNYIRSLCPYRTSTSSSAPSRVAFREFDTSSLEWGEVGTGGLSMDNDFLPIMMTAKVPPLYDARAGWNGSFMVLNDIDSTKFRDQTFVNGYSFADFYSGWRSIPPQLGLQRPDGTTYVPIKSDFLTRIGEGMDFSDGKRNYIGIEYLFELSDSLTWSLRSVFTMYDGRRPEWGRGPYLVPADWGSGVYTVEPGDIYGWRNDSFRNLHTKLYYNYNSISGQNANISIFVKVPSGGIGKITTGTQVQYLSSSEGVFAKMATWVERDYNSYYTQFVNDLLEQGEDVDPDPPDPEPPGPEPGGGVNPYEPAGGVDTTDTGPTEGTFTHIHDDIDWTPQLDTIASMGLTRWYACDRTQIELLGKRLLSTNVLAEIVKYFTDFKSLIISVKHLPFLIDPEFNCEAESDIGFAFLGLADQVVMTRGRKIKDGIQVCTFGQVTVPRFYGNFIDYKYTSYEIYLPYLGVTALDPELVAGHEIDLTYTVDLLTGDASIQIQNTDNDDIISILNTHLSVDIALSESGNNSIQLIEALLSTAAPIAGAGAALAGNISAMPSLAPTQLGGAMPIKPEKPDKSQYQDDGTQYKEAMGQYKEEMRQYDQQTSMNDAFSNYQKARNDNILNALINYRPHLTGSSFSSMSGVTGRLNPQKAYLLIRRPILVQSSNQSLMGYPCYIGGEISEFIGTGYTEFCDIRFEGEFLYSSQEELTLIKEALRNGVIL